MLLVPNKYYGKANFITKIQGGYRRDVIVDFPPSTYIIRTETFNILVDSINPSYYMEFIYVLLGIALFMLVITTGNIVSINFYFHLPTQ